MKETLTLEQWRSFQWEPIATVTVYEPERGLYSPMRLDYITSIELLDSRLMGVVEEGSECDDGDDDNEDEDFDWSLGFDEQVGIRFSGGLLSSHRDEPVAALLRDLIPSGWGRQQMAARLFYLRKDGPSRDILLLRQGAQAPIGNLRIKPVRDDDCFEPLIKGYSVEELTYGRGMLRLEQEACKGLPLWAGLGAGGESPKLLISRCTDGLYYWEGARPDFSVTDHWLVKFPREPLNRSRKEILRAEFLYMTALKKLGFDIPEVHWLDDSLWVRRFDRGPEGQRYSVESLYSAMGRIGDGARLYHDAVLDELLPLARDPDGLLTEYLIRDKINRLLGNCDNHGRNLSFHRSREGLYLTPIYDLAPMVMDDDGVSWATVWSDAWQTRGRPEWERIVRHFAQEPERVFEGLRKQGAALRQLADTEEWQALPESVKRHPRIMSPSALADL